MCLIAFRWQPDARQGRWSWPPTATSFMPGRQAAARLVVTGRPGRWPAATGRPAVPGWPSGPRRSLRRHHQFPRSLTRRSGELARAASSRRPGWIRGARPIDAFAGRFVQQAPGQWGPFNLVFGDTAEALWIVGTHAEPAPAIEPGVHALVQPPARHALAQVHSRRSADGSNGSAGRGRRRRRPPRPARRPPAGRRPRIARYRRRPRARGHALRAVHRQRPLRHPLVQRAGAGDPPSRMAERTFDAYGKACGERVFSWKRGTPDAADAVPGFAAVSRWPAAPNFGPPFRA